MFSVDPKRSRDGDDGAWQQQLLRLRIERFHLSRIFARVLGQDAHARRNIEQTRCEELTLLAIVDAAMTQQDHRPDHEDDADLGLVFAHHDVDRTLGHVGGLGAHARELLGEDGVAAWPDVHHVERVHQDRGDDQRKGTKQEVALLLAVHGCARAQRLRFRCRLGMLHCYPPMISVRG